MRRLATLSVFLFAFTAFAREPLPIDQGKSGLLLTLRKLHTTARLMHTAAHPDDEDGGMLTLESRGRGVMAVQMTLTRGEGGQNAVGKELGDELGMLRTLELLEADRYYGVDQRFSRVADFGYSKTAEETLKKWDARNTALPDLVRVIRTYRPDVVISRFVGDDSDGHGNHQASGILTREAFRMAGDPTKFPEQIKQGLQPFQPKKFYTRARGDDWNVELDVNTVDPLLGMSTVEWAFKGLKHQLSQGSANWTLGRVYTSHYKLVDTTIPNYKPGHEKDFFDGIDTNLVALAEIAPAAAAFKPLLQELTSLIDQATTAANKDPKSAAVPLLQGFAKSKVLIDQIKKSRLTDEQKQTLLVALETKRDQFRDAANFDLGITLTAEGTLQEMKDVTDPTTQIWLAAVPGKGFVPKFSWTGIEAMSVNISRPARDIISGARTWTMAAVDHDAAYTRQYWHRDDPDRESIYKIDDPQFATLDLTPWPFVAHGTYEYQGLKGEIESTVEVAEPKAHPLIVGPAWSVLLPQSTLVVPTQTQKTVELVPAFRSNLPNPVAGGVLKYKGTLGSSSSFERLMRPPVSGGTATATIQLKPDTTTGERRGHESVALESGNNTFDLGYSVLTRDDLGTAYYFRKATQPVSIVDIKVPQNLKVGYIMGVGDDIPEVLKSIGVNVTLITPDELKSGDLSQYSTIVLGIRAHEGSEAVRQNNQRLLDYASNGGTLVVQYIYQTGQFNEGHYAPYPLTLSRNNKDRVTVEEAPVEILTPNNAIFHSPNQITQKDFDGWVQERALYCPTEWDSHYTPLLSSHDPNDPPEKGGLLVAKLGKGTYIFNTWSFFRQLPAGVPGAIRLYVNLLNSGHN